MRMLTGPVRLAGIEEEEAAILQIEASACTASQAPTPGRYPKLTGKKSGS